MFRIVAESSSASTHNAGTTGSHAQRHSTSIKEELNEAEFLGADEDAEMQDGDGAGPNRAQAIGGYGRVTGPGETIADSGRWMR